MDQPRPVTLWFYYDKNNFCEFNHLEYGWSTNPSPIANCDFQKKSWKNRMWEKKFGHLIDNKVCYDN